MTNKTLEKLNIFCLLLTVSLPIAFQSQMRIGNLSPVLTGITHIKL